MYELPDVTLLFQVRIDSPHRLRNLQLNIQYLIRHLHVPILIGEEGPPYHITGRGILRSQGVRIVQVPISYPDLFWRTHVTNILIKTSSTPYAASLDCDVLFFPWQYAEAYRLLSSGLADTVYPFDKPTKRVTRCLHPSLARTCDLSLFAQLPDSNGEVATGCCLFFDVIRFRQFGLENEHIIGWGPEDNERDVRLRHLGARLCRISGPLFHLEHRRSLASRMKHQMTEANEKEFARIASLRPRNLSAEILTWPWTREGGLAEFDPL